MYKCQYCESEKIKGRVPLVLGNSSRTNVIIEDSDQFSCTIILCDVCEDCGHILRLYFDKPSQDFKVDGVEYNK
jgi:hypothetical protein